jgi:proline iminopeptidase
MTSPVHNPVRPFDAIMLSVGDGHWIYAEQIGNPEGVPMLFLHGGPGSGAQHAHRALFDISKHHTILTDQRGAGRSHPYLSTTANTTAHLIADIEALRLYFGFEKWLVVGGSWGSTLALAYAQAHPERVTGLVLRAIFLGTDAEIYWAFIEGPRRFRPDLYLGFINFLTESEREDPIQSYVVRLTHPNPAVHAPAAQVWNAYERALSELAPARAALPAAFDAASRIPPTPLIEAHYIRNHFFLKPNELLASAGRLRGIPGRIIQGRYDLLCPPQAAHAVANAWPDCRLEIIDQAGHAMTEPGVEAAMIAAINELALL